MAVSYCERTWKRFVSYMEKAEPGILFLVNSPLATSQYTSIRVQSPKKAPRQFTVKIENGFLVFYAYDPETRNPFEVSRLGVPKRGRVDVHKLCKSFFSALDLGRAAVDERKKAMDKREALKRLHLVFVTVREKHGRQGIVSLPAVSETWNYNLDIDRVKVGLRLPDVWLSPKDVDDFCTFWTEFQERVGRPPQQDFVDGLRDEDGVDLESSST